MLLRSRAALNLASERRRDAAPAILGKLLAVLIAGCTGTGALNADQHAFPVARTVDDLPSHGVLLSGSTREAVARPYLTPFKANGVPEAFAFVNAKKIDEQPETEAILRMWRIAR